MRLMVPVIGTDLECEKRLLKRQVGADDQHGLLLIEVECSSQRIRRAAYGIE